MALPPRSPKKVGISAKAGKKKSKKKREAPKATVADEEDIYQEPVKRIVRPENQLVLTEVQLKEDITRVLTGDDPNRPRNISKFNYKEKCYKLDPPGQSDHMAIHFALEGCSLHIESEEYLKLKELEEKRKEEEAEARKSVQQGDGLDNDAGKMEGKLDSDDKNKNQFDYSERAAQTLNNPSRNQGVSTEPPPVAQYSANVSQWQIYDSYVSECLIGMMEHNGNSGDNSKLSFEDRLSIILDEGSKEKDTMHSANMARSLKITERLVSQNAQDEIFQDFKYWEDASDQFRQGEGSLLPLWRFATDRTKRKQVTALCWNPHYSDLFAVGYGSYDFMRQGSGMICCFSLKNTSFPEYIFATESGVMCIDFHPEHHSLLAVGCYDGTVMVYNVCSGGVKPIYASSIKTGKHTDPVWQVHWQKEDFGKEPNFYSISSDGRVINWSMSKNELKMEPVMQLKLFNSVKDEPDETTLSGLAGGCCFDFNEKQEHLFVVGTEEGNIHKCSKAYSGQYLQTYEGHHMAVYAVKWNPFHESIFLSCSADWTVKVWDHNLSYPIMSFDLGNAVGDVSWSPYSSTVFSAVTSDGKVHVFDLAENKNEALCEQKVVKRARLTHTRFNSRDYILIVGDDRGGVNSLKLSPNLRKLHLPIDEDGNALPDVNTAAIQLEKIEKLLAAIDAKPPPKV